MTDTVTDSGREQRLTERVEQLYANDRSFGPPRRRRR